MVETRSAGMRVLVLAILVTTSFPAIAQDMKAPAATPDNGGEIVVTATRRAEPLSKVPISVAAYGQAQMDVQGVRQVQDIVSMTPGLSFSQNSGFNTSNSIVSVRGIVSKAGAATTGVYIDDTPIQAIGDIENYVGSAFPKVFDLDRVEVLRGPQGTLFGGGAEGGVVRFITPQPGLTDYTGYGRAEVSSTRGGDLNYEAGAAVGGPIITDKLGFRLSGWYRRDGGYTDRQPYTTGQYFKNSDDADSVVLRAAVTLAPTARLKITPAFFYQRVHSDDQSTYWPDLTTGPRLIRGNAAASPVTDRFTLSTLTANYNMDAVSVTSVTSYFRRKGTSTNDLTNVSAALLDGINFPTLPGIAYYDISFATTTQSVWTQEVRAQSSDAGAPFRWVVGAFYQNSRQTSGEKNYDPYLNQILGPDYPFVLLPGDAASIVANTFKQEQFAGFANFDYSITDTLSVGGGVRVARSVLNFRAEQNGPFSPYSLTLGRLKETPVTPKFTVSWQQTPRTLYYATVAKGYRTGGLNVPLPQFLCGNDLATLGLNQTPASYTSDHTWSYEVGTKGRLGGSTLRYDASAYHIDWSNVQLQTLLPCGYAYTANAGSAVSNGFDLSLQLKPVKAVELGLAVGYVNAHYTKEVIAGSSIVAQDGAKTGNPTTGDVVPPWTVSVSGQYDFTVAADVESYVRVQYDFNSHNPGPFTTFNPGSLNYDPTIPANPATHFVKARIGAKLAKMDISLFADNLLDSRPQLGLQHSFASSPAYNATTFRPRTIGVTVTARY